ncbi:MAG: ABC transporter permease, partial [Actinomycetia bacterium]|nr:ABC transporter permease [Actinomycetes bacterium]
MRRRTPQTQWRSRLRPGDALVTGTLGLRSRKGRTFLTALGIAIGIASMIAVLGISASSKADLIAEIDDLGTNLLEVRAGSDLFGETSKLPVEAPAMVRRVGPVEEAASIAQLDTDVQRNRYLDDSNGL